MEDLPCRTDLGLRTRVVVDHAGCIAGHGYLLNKLYLRQLRRSEGGRRVGGRGYSRSSERDLLLSLRGGRTKVSFLFVKIREELRTSCVTTGTDPSLRRARKRPLRPPKRRRPHFPLRGDGSLFALGSTTCQQMLHPGRSGRHRPLEK